MLNIVCMIKPFLLSIVISILFLRFYILVALQKKIIDIPNERSSHSIAKPRGAGILFPILLLFTAFDSSLYLALIIAFIGFMDDLYHLSSKKRLVVQIIVSLLFLWMNREVFGNVDTIPFYLLLILFVSSINTFNFIDGIDGILTTLCMSGLFWMFFSTQRLPHPNLIFAVMILLGALVGFLFFNWSPSKCFMGDVGSGYLGFICFALYLFCFGSSYRSLILFCILYSPIFADCTFTLLKRIKEKKKFMEAHREHLYQKLSIKWKSHPKVTLLYGCYSAFITGPLFYYGNKSSLSSTSLLGILILVSLPVFIASSFKSIRS